MTAAQITVPRCDAVQTDCTETVPSRPRETNYELRRRAMRENGWRYSVRGDTVQDLCRWHA